MNMIEICPACDGQSLDVRDYDPNPYAERAGWPAQHCFVDKTIAICRDCGLGFTREVMSDDEISAFYQAVYSAPQARIHSPKISEFNEFTPRFFTQVLFVKNFIQLFDGMRVLEIGPNEVSTLPAYSLFCKPDYSYFDQMDWPIIKSYGGRCLGRYASGDAIREKFTDASVDLIHSSHSLEHINPSALNDMFDGISRVIKDGGHLFFEVPDDYAYEGLGPPHTLFFTEDSIRRLLAQYGFEAIVVAHWDGGGRARDHFGDKLGTVKHPRRKTHGETIRALLRRVVLGNESIARLTKPWRLRRAFAVIMKQIPTPYEASPYYRVLARRCPR
ncbi:MAG: methyltransferase domain-containing protein [Gammaproteobacteria bacterium]|jgi:SAM-dependent methyltransferase